MSFLALRSENIVASITAASLTAATILSGCAGPRALGPALPAAEGLTYRAGPDGVKLYPVKPAEAGLLEITSGPDGALWFTEQIASQIGRITTGGKLSYYKTPTARAQPNGIATGPDKTLWFTEGIGRVGRITTAGHVTEYKVPHPAYAITKGPDGALWFTENAGTMNWIGRITTSGKVKEYKVPSKNATAVSGITVGPDGALWFTLELSNQVGRITTSGKVRLFTNTDGDARPSAIVSDSSALWAGESDGVAKITTSGHFTEYALLPSGGGAVMGITRGSNGGVWFAVYQGNDVGTIAGGKVKEYATGKTSEDGMWDITLGSDKALWFTDTINNRIGRFTP